MDDAGNGGEGNGFMNQEIASTEEELNNTPGVIQGDSRVSVVYSQSNGTGVGGGVVGIIAFVLSWIPVAGIPIGIILGLLAIILSGVGLSKSSHLPNRAGQGMAIAGLTLGIVTIVFKFIPWFNLL